MLLSKSKNNDYDDDDDENDDDEDDDDDDDDKRCLVVNLHLTDKLFVFCFSIAQNIIHLNFEIS